MVGKDKIKIVKNKAGYSIHCNNQIAYWCLLCDELIREISNVNDKKYLDIRNHMY